MHLKLVTDIMLSLWVIANISISQVFPANISPRSQFRQQDEAIEDTTPHVENKAETSESLDYTHRSTIILTEDTTVVLVPATTETEPTHVTWTTSTNAVEVAGAATTGATGIDVTVNVETVTSSVIENNEEPMKQPEQQYTIGKPTVILPDTTTTVDVPDRSATGTHDVTQATVITSQASTTRVVEKTTAVFISAALVDYHDADDDVQNATIISGDISATGTTISSTFPAVRSNVVEPMVTPSDTTVIEPMITPNGTTVVETMVNPNGTTMIEPMITANGTTVTGNVDDDICEPNEVVCSNPGRKPKCVPKFWVCDGDRDCDDGSDEDQRYCDLLSQQAYCKPSEFRCVGVNGTDSNPLCLQRSLQCDRRHECPDGSDEIGCVKPTVILSTHRTIQIIADNTLTIQCIAQGTPAPYINWRLRSRRVCGDGYDRERCRMSHSTDPNDRSLVIGTLTIDRAHVNDSGAYSCEALNNQGSSFDVPVADVLVIHRHY